MKVSVKDTKFSKAADLRTSRYSQVAELWLVNLIRMNSLRRCEDSSRF